MIYDDDNTEFPDVPVPPLPFDVTLTGDLGNLPAGVEELPAPPEVPPPIKWREWL